MPAYPVYPIPQPLVSQLGISRTFLPTATNWSRGFDAVDDQILLTGGSIGAIVNGAFSIVALVKPSAAGGPNTIIALESSTTTLAALVTGGSNLSLYAEADDTFAYVALTPGVWHIVAVTKASGTATPRFHAKPLVGGSWTHANGAASITAKTGTITQLRLNGMKLFGSVSGFNAHQDAVAAIFPTALSDANIEAIGTASSSSSMVGLGAVSLINLDQSSVGTSVSDLVGTFAQSSITGSYAQAEPLIWDFSVAVPTPALYFDGIGGYVDFDIPFGHAAENLPSAAFTLALLIRPEGAIDTIDRGFLDHGDVVGQSHLYFGCRGPEDPLSSLRAKTDSMTDFQGLDNAIYDAAIPSNAGDTPEFVVVVRWDGSSYDSVFSILERGVGGFTHTQHDLTGDNFLPGGTISGGRVRIGAGFFDAPGELYIGMDAAWDRYLTDSEVESLVHTDNLSVYSESWQALSPIYLHHPISDSSIPDIMGTGLDASTFNSVTLNPNGFFDVYYTGSPPSGGGSTPVGVSETHTLSDGTPVISVTMALTDALTLADSSPALAAALGLTDALTITDSSSVSQQTAINVTDSLVVTDATTALSATLSLVDTLTLSDASSIAAGIALADSATVSDASSVLNSTLVNLVDSGALTDGTPSIVTTVSLADALTLSESISIAATLAIVDALTLGEAVLAGNITDVALSDSATHSEGTTSIAAQLGVSDAATFSETWAGQVALSISDSAVQADASAVLAALGISDSLVVTDNLVLTTTQFKALSDSLTFSDSIATGTVQPAPPIKLPATADIGVWAASVLITERNLSIEMAERLQAVIVEANNDKLVEVASNLETVDILSDGITTVDVTSRTFTVEVN